MTFKAFGEKTRPDRVKAAAPPPRDAPKGEDNNHNINEDDGGNDDDDDDDDDDAIAFHDARFPREEEEAMVAASHSIKADANRQFGNSDYEAAISTYDRAAAELPSYLDYELAVLQSNIAACHVKLGQWKEAVESCERGLEGLEREMPLKQGEKRKQKKKRDGAKEKKGRTGKGLESGSESESEDETRSGQRQQEQDKGSKPDSGQVVELPSDAEEEELEQKLKELDVSDARKAEIRRIRTKLWLRRARARSSMEPASWANLGGALEDYQLLASPEYFSTLPVSDQKTVRQALVTLPPRVNEAKDREVGEMMGKLKELGNGILRPFGLSTDMFKMTQGADGGWSMSIDQTAGKGK